MSFKNCEKQVLVVETKSTIAISEPLSIPKAHQLKDEIKRARPDVRVRMVGAMHSSEMRKVFIHP